MHDSGSALGSFKHDSKQTNGRLKENEEPYVFRKLQYEHGQFLVNFIAMLDRCPEQMTKQAKLDMHLLQRTTEKPKIESRTFKVPYIVCVCVCVCVCWFISYRNI
jgi:hypothetical protein